MDMILLFGKLILSGIGLLCLWMGSRKTIQLIKTLTKRSKRQAILNDLSRDNIYDDIVLNRSVNNFIPPKCQNAPPGKKTVNGKKIAPQDLIKKMDLFLDYDTATQQMVVFGDSGMGKTSFLINYFSHNLQRPKREQHTIVFIPMNSKDVDKLINTYSDQKHVLFLDGFDEQINNIDNHSERLQQILALSKTYKRVVITCQTSFFATDVTAQQDPVKYKKCYLSRLNQIDAKKLVNLHFSLFEISQKKKAFQLIKSNPKLLNTPLVARHYRELIAENSHLNSITDLYDLIVQNWISNETQWPDNSKLEFFSQKLAVDLFSKRNTRGKESIDREELLKIIPSWGGVEFFELSNDNSSVIYQSKQGEIKFSHRSFLEHLFVKRMLSGDKACYQNLLTSKMVQFLLVALKNRIKTNYEMEFNWLTNFRLLAHGLTLDPSQNDAKEQVNIYKQIVLNNPKFEFLNHIIKLTQNPIFFEFGWEPELNHTIQKSVTQSESCLMKLESKGWMVMIDPQKIEITKNSQKNQIILINKQDVSEYNSISKNMQVLKLYNAYGIHGFLMMTRLNKSKNFCLIPDLKTLNRFTLYFLLGTAKK